MRTFVAICTYLCLALPAAADALVERLTDAMQAPRLLQILADEGAASADQIEMDFLQGDGGTIFAETVERLNDPARLLPVLQERLREELTDLQIQQVLIFLESDLGQTLMDLELSARQAMSDDSIDQAVRDKVARDGVRPQVTQMIEQGDLVARNTVDSQAVLRQFFMGRRAAGVNALGARDIEGFVAEAGPGIEEETSIWLDAFLTLAYSPLGDDDLDDYVAFWGTDAGMAYDLALFAAFGSIFQENSFALGQLVGRLELAQDI